MDRYHVRNFVLTILLDSALCCLDICSVQIYGKYLTIQQKMTIIFQKTTKTTLFLFKSLPWQQKVTVIFCRFQYWVILKSCFILPSSTGVVSSRRSSSGVMCVAGLKSAEPIYAIMLVHSWRASGYSCS